MNRFKNQLIIAAVFGGLALIGSLMNSHPANAQIPPIPLPNAGLPVTVLGPNPLPVSGSVTLGGPIAGTVAATQSGVWNVGITGTPNVNVANTAQVQVTGTPNVNVTGTPNVNVANTPQVQVSGTPNVNVANTPQVQVANSMSSPVLTRAVDNPGLEPFESSGNGVGTILTFMVPTGKTLVIENVSFMCIQPATMILADFRLFVGSNIHTFAPVQLNTQSGYELVTNQVTRIYAAGGSTVTLYSAAFPSGSGCIATVDGHLVASLP